MTILGLAPAPAEKDSRPCALPCPRLSQCVAPCRVVIMHSMHRIHVQQVICYLIASAGIAATAFPADVDYLRDIKPVLKAKCYSCHGAIRQEANLRLDTVEFMRTGGDTGPAVKIGDELHSDLLFRVTATDEPERMPPEGEPLSLEQIARFRVWLAGGATAPADEQPQANPKTHWAFQPLPHVVLPAGDHPIDAFIDRRLEGAGLRRSPPANVVSLIRRMFMDLHGLPPTPQQIAEWTQRISESRRTTEQANAAAGQGRALIDELLDSPRYGERWAQHWLDIVRYADTHGFEVNTPRPNAWPYRDYVIEAFNEDKPYDRFVLEQLAGDSVGEDAATGFMVAAAALLPGQIGKDEESKRLARQDELDEIIVGTTATFLGMTVGCARCHDHKFDPISQTDYYAMQAFFAGVDYGDREVRGDEYQLRMARANKLQPQIAAVRSRLNQFATKAFAGRTIIIDDEDLDHVTLLKTKNGHGTNPDEAGRGYRNDVGDSSRYGNLSRSRYTWWDNNSGEDVFTWNPDSKGRFRLWISWGVHGSGVHTRDARYVLDHDGNLATKNDQKQIALADQYYFVGVTDGESEQKPLWSGLFDAGVHDFSRTTRLILRGGETGTGVTADVIVIQETTANATPLPRLRAPVNALKTVEHFEPVTARFVRFTSFRTIDDDKHEPCIDELEVFTAGSNPINIALADRGTSASSSGNYSNTGKHQLQHVNDGNYGNSYSWISNERGKGWVQLEFSKDETIDRIEWARDREGKFKDRLPLRYRIDTSLDGQNWTLVAHSDDRLPMGTPHNDVAALLRNGSSADGTDLSALATQLQRLEKQQANLRKPQLVFSGKFREPDKTFVLNRGDPEQPTTEIAPHVLTSISSVDLPQHSGDQQRRAALAKWITSPDNPLAARVMVNRIWQYHFGAGLVETSSDFGLNGAAPSHPELLDWLAQEFISNNWSVKHLHRVIMSSQTYQQASSRTNDMKDVNAQIADPAAVDSGNRLLWHFRSRRMEAEAIRDCMLQISGQLNLKMGGPGFNFFKSRGGLSGFPPIETFTANEMRRMVYAHKIRMEPVPVFGAFDCPDAGLPTPRRSQSTTAIQALNLFNSSFVIDQAEAFAKHVQAKAGESVEEQAGLAFRLALGRPLSEAEKVPVLDTVKTHGLPTLCRALFNSSEFLFIP
ncbi:MAG TPA: DUF1553 domain-containing protein [Fuerstia sp.]|nr:DUF1553 domain-containing protein [Fuerstiella sp.]